MRIGFDVSQTAEGKAGCGYVADQLIRNLARLDQKNEYLLYPTFYLYRDPEYHKVTAPHAPNMKMHFSGASFREMVHGWETRMEDRSSWLGSLTSSIQIIFHASGTTGPKQFLSSMISPSLFIPNSLQRKTAWCALTDYLMRAFMPTTALQFQSTQKMRFRSISPIILKTA